MAQRSHTRLHLHNDATHSETLEHIHELTWSMRILKPWKLTQSGVFPTI